MSDPLADGLAHAQHALRTDRDRRFARSLREQHESGKPLSANQLYWANQLITRAGREPVTTQFDKVETDIFSTDTPSAKPAAATDEHRGHFEVDAATLEGCVAKVLAPISDALLAQNDERESNLAARQQAFNTNAAKSIAQACVKEALKQLDARVPRQVNIIVQRDDGTKWQSDSAQAQHPQFEELLRMATLRKDDGYAPGIFIAGERGSGKTTGTRNAASALGLTWFSNGAISFSSEMLGYMDGHGNYHRTPFRNAFELGGWYTFDEVDRSDPGALLAVNPHLANNEAAFPDGMVKRHKDCIITATGNTWGLGATLEFSGATKLDEAFLSRFEIKLPWDVDTTFERKLVANADWHDYVQQARQRIRDAGIKYTIDSRAAIAGARMISQLGYTHAQAAKQTYLASLKPDQRSIVAGLGEHAA